MPKYLFTGSYSPAGAAGVLKEGGTGRADAARALIESVGGSLETIYWTFGERDFIVIADLPDDTAAASASITVGASGSISVSTTKLLTAKDLDEAVGRTAAYRPPGQ